VSLAHIVSLSILSAEAPKDPEDFSLVASDFQTKILPGITHWGHPRFFAYFPAITNFESILADMMATSVSNPGFNVSTEWEPSWRVRD
jgi:aromatic-L-amino-acid decarboxylase